MKLEKRNLAHHIADANKIIFFTGAGVSTESGIADFRSPGGIWSKITPIEFSDFMADEEVRLEDWRRRFHFQKEFDAAQPNDGHLAIAELAERGKVRALITQNIDGLHHRSGVSDDLIIELHGNGTTAKCLDCETGFALDDMKDLIARTGTAPRCDACGGLIKSAVISFGQPMPKDKMIDAHAACLDCDLFVVLGSSLVVQPAASLPIIAKQNGTPLIIVNRDPTPLDDYADLVLRGSIGNEMAQAIVDLEPS
ncbi:MAG: Sir2 family NAD-dependent protein deacetylase [Pseudomonadota bacterium]